jgi:fructokinase
VRIVSIGEILWDVVGASEYLGGAPLNFAAHAHKLGHEVFLLSAVGDDDRGRRALRGLGNCGISAELVQTKAGRPTGIAEVELGPDGKPMFRIVRPAAYDFLAIGDRQLKRIAELEPDWIYFGTLYHNSRHSLGGTLQLLRQAPNAKRLYDVNLRDGNWTLSVVEELAAQATVIKLSDSEAEFLDGSLTSEDLQGSVEDFCRRWSEQYSCKTICVTLGERGCCIFREGQYVEAPGRKVNVVDTIGAGDAFAAGFVHAIEQGWSDARCGKFANAVAALVASRPGATPDWTVDEVWAMLGEKTPWV